MKKTNQILILFFLVGMLFTVFQYLPILEEEVPSHRTELVKKMKESDGSGSDDDTDTDADDSDPDTFKTGWISDILSYYSFSQASRDDFYCKVPLYQSRIATINTPPPKA